jgi:hypothetical protein
MRFSQKAGYGAAASERRGDRDDWGKTPGDEHRQALRRLEAKQQVICQLIDGRLPLLEAAAHFRSLSRMSGAPPAPGHAAFRPDNDEGLCRTVIGWAHLALNDRPERADLLSAQLETELQDHLTRHGGVRLPW